jgi:hypothetical protein
LSELPLDGETLQKIKSLEEKHQRIVKKGKKKLLFFAELSAISFSCN